MPGSDRRRTPAAPAAAGLVLSALVALAAGCSPSGPGAPLARVGEGQVTREEFIAAAQEPEVMQQYQGLPDSLAKRQLLDDLVDREVIAEAARREGLDEVPEYAAIEEQLLPTLLPDALYEKRIGAVTRASEAEARLWYDAQTTEYRLGVLMTPDSLAMRTLLNRLDQGEAFGEVARTGSMDPQSAQSDGLLPNWVTPGQLPPLIEQAITPLEVGQRTPILKQRTGSFVFQVMEKRPRENAPPYEEQVEGIQALLVNRKRGVIVERYLDGLKARYGLLMGGPGWTVVDDGIAMMPDTMSRWLTVDPARAGVTKEQLEATLAVWADEPYTVADLLADLAATPRQERPPANRSDLFRTYVEGQAMTDILEREARREGLDESPAVRAQVARARSTWLVQRWLEKHAPPEGLQQPDAAELDSIVTAMVQGMGGAMPPGGVRYGDLPPAIQQEILAGVQRERQQAWLRREIDRLRVATPPVVNESVYRSIPWPVPAPDDPR